MTEFKLVPRDVLAGLVKEIEHKTCDHGDTYRGGNIWTICQSCGKEWADDNGGKPEFKWPECVESARAILAAPQQAAEPVAWRPKLAHPIPYVTGAPRESDLKHWEGNMGVEIETLYAGNPPAQPEQPPLSDDDIARIAIECGLQSSEEHWGTVYRACSRAQLRAFAVACSKMELPTERPAPIQTSEFERGALTAIALIIRCHDAESLAFDILNEMGLNGADCSELDECDKEDLSQLIGYRGAKLRGLTRPAAPGVSK